VTASLSRISLFVSFTFSSVVASQPGTRAENANEALLRANYVGQEIAAPAIH
jgi:hypothetical protein